MTLDVVQSMALLLISLLAIVILLRILVIVHGQKRHVKELELRMKAMEKMNGQTSLPTDQPTNDGKES